MVILSFVKTAHDWKTQKGRSRSGFITQISWRRGLCEAQRGKFLNQVNTKLFCWNIQGSTPLSSTFDNGGSDIMQQGQSLWTMRHIRGAIIILAGLAFAIAELQSWMARILSPTIADAMLAAVAFAVAMLLLSTTLRHSRARTRHHFPYPPA